MCGKAKIEPEEQEESKVEESKVEENKVEDVPEVKGSS